MDYFRFTYNRIGIKKGGNMDFFDVDELEESAKRILNANPKNLTVTEFMGHFKAAHERDLVPSHYGCQSAADLILLMSSKFKFMNIIGDDCGSFRINLCQQVCNFL